MLVVLIPTFNRPNLLKTALDSVSKQTYLKYIDKIIVSENGQNPGSRLVCEEFSQLNIEYIYQEHQLPVLDHLKWLMSRVKTGRIAFLSDDDWWSVWHIELAIRNLNENSNFIAYFSNFVYSSEEYKIDFSSYIGAKILSIEGGRDANYDLLKFKKEDIFLFSFIVTPFHFSSLVCEAEYLAKAVSVFDEIHPTYSDRVLWPVLSMYGNILFNPLATTIIRNHPSQDSNNYSSSEWRLKNQEGSLFILNLANRERIEIKNRINIAYDNNGLESKQELNQEIDRIFIDRKNIEWYSGYEEIIKSDKVRLDLVNREKSYIVYASRKVRKILRRFI